MANLSGTKKRTIGSDTRFQRGMGEPGKRVELWDHDCPRCESRHTVQIERGSVLHDRLESTNWNHVQVLCDDCQEVEA